MVRTSDSVKIVAFKACWLEGLSFYDSVLDVNGNGFGPFDDLAFLVADLRLQCVLTSVRAAYLQ